MPSKHAANVVALLACLVLDGCSRSSEREEQPEQERDAEAVKLDSTRDSVDNVGLLDTAVEQLEVSVVAPIVTADGVGWRIRDGRYESVLSGLRLTPPPGWRFVIGPELERLDTKAEIVLSNEHDGAYVALVVERASKPKLAALVARSRQMLEDKQSVVPVGVFERNVAGREVEFRRYDKASITAIHGVYVGDEAYIQLLVSFPLDLADQSIASVDRLLAGIEVVPKAERAGLRRELLERSRSPVRFAEARAYRGGEFLDYDHALRWTKPAGLWQVDRFEVGLQHSPETVLSATELDLGIYLTIEAFDSDGAEQDILTSLTDGDELLSSKARVVDGSTIYRALTVHGEGATAIIYDIAVTRRGSGIVVTTARSLDDTPKHRKVMAAAIEALEYDVALETTKLVDGVFHDVRHGVSFELPKGFGAPSITEVANGQVANGQVMVWTDGSRELVFTAITSSVIDEIDVHSPDFVEHIVRQQESGNLELGTPKRSQGKLGDHATTHLSWKGGLKSMEADLLTLDSTFYSLTYANLTVDEISRIQTSWSMLE